MDSDALDRLCNKVRERRHALRMSVDGLARRSRVSRATVQRILAGSLDAANLGNVAAVAGALGLTIQFTVTTSAEAFREQEAERKARRLVNLTQGTMALEAQAIGTKAIDDEVQRAKHALLAGSSRLLWGE